MIKLSVEVDKLIYHTYLVGKLKNYACEEIVAVELLARYLKKNQINCISFKDLLSSRSFH